jgi:hypothetical protein
MTLRISEEFSTRLIDWSPFVVCTENLNTGVAVMKSAQDGA